MKDEYREALAIDYAAQLFKLMNEYENKQPQLFVKEVRLLEFSAIKKHGIYLDEIVETMDREIKNAEEKLDRIKQIRAKRAMRNSPFYQN